MKRKLKYLKLPEIITDLEGEIWKKVVLKNLSYQYEVSNKGRIKYFSRSVPRLLKLPKNNKNKYQCITLYGYNLIPDISIGVHVIVAIHFVDNPLNLPEVNHEDFDPTNNNDWNLKWVTKKQNAQHALTAGRYKFKFGSDNKSSKLVLNVETGIYYDSLKEAVVSHNLKYSTTQHRLRGLLQNFTALRYA